MKKELQKIMGIDTNCKIKKVKEQGDEVIIDVEWKKIRGFCPVCGEKVGSVHQRHGKRCVLHDIQASGKRIYIQFPRVRLKCRQCKKVFSIYPKGVFPRIRVTSKMLTSIFLKLRKGSFSEVASWAHIHPRSLTSYVKKLLKNKVNWEAFKDQKVIRLGIDEHFASKRNVVILICELVSSSPLAMLSNYRKEDLVRFLDEIPPWVKKRIDEVSIDMKTSYKNAIHDVLGPSVRIVADPFHVVKDANKRLDEMRRVCEEVYFAQTGLRKKIPKRILMKANEKLSLSGKIKLEKILEENESLKVFYQFKEKIRNIYKSKSYKEAEEKYNALLSKMQSYKMWPALKRWENSLKRWKPYILNHFFSGTSNGKVEGYNTVIKTLKRISFGIKDVELYIKKIMLGLVPIDLLPHFLT